MKLNQGKMSMEDNNDEEKKVKEKNIETNKDKTKTKRKQKSLVDKYSRDNYKYITNYTEPKNNTKNKYFDNKKCDNQKLFFGYENTFKSLNSCSEKTIYNDFYDSIKLEETKSNNQKKDNCKIYINDEDKDKNNEKINEKIETLQNLIF